MKEYDFAINCAGVIVAINLPGLLIMYESIGGDPTDLFEVAAWAYHQGYVTDKQELTQKGRALLSIGVDSLSS